MLEKLEEVKLSTIIEAILYLKAQSISIPTIAELAGCNEQEAQDALIELMNDYAHRESALEIVENVKGYSLQLRSCFDTLLKNLIPAELNTSTLRTLAAIAIKSPILQTELINLRGSSAYQQVQELVTMGFINKRRQEDGRSYWLETTEKFHQYFELEQLSQEVINFQQQEDVIVNVENIDFITPES